MTIRREDLDAGRVDFGDATTGKALNEITPGLMPRLEFLGPLRLSAYALARAMKVPPNRVTAILKNERAISADTALRLGRALGTSPEFWLRVQMAHDLRVARASVGKQIEEEVEPVAA